MKSDKCYIVDGQIVAAKQEMFAYRDVPNWAYGRIDGSPSTIRMLMLVSELDPLIEQLADERQQVEQQRLDGRWSVYDKAAAGDKDAITTISMWRKFGAKMPTSRTAERHVQSVGFYRYELRDSKAKAYCKWCDDPIYRIDSKHRHQFCSNTCADAAEQSWRDEFAASYVRPRKTPVPQTCAYTPCSATYTPLRSDSRYCSVKCRVAAHRGK